MESLQEMAQFSSEHNMSHVDIDGMAVVEKLWTSGINDPAPG